MRVLTVKQKALVLPVLVLLGTFAMVLVVMAFMNTPKNEVTQNGVGANGFSVYVEDDANLGIDKAVSKEDVSNVLQGKAKSISDVEVSKVVNYNGDRGQTATYNFVRVDGVKASLYVDTMQFKSAASLKNSHIFNMTASAGDIQGKPSYFMLAQTMGSVREYRLMVVNDLHIYKFVIDQPVNDPQNISEVSAINTLKKLAAKANLDI